MTLLDAADIRAPLAGRPGERLDELEVFAELDSTNSYLMSAAPPAAGRYRVALAEHQVAGRGRMNNRWHSPAGSGLCLSVAYTFAQTRVDLSAVTLAAGVSVARLLESDGVHAIRLKWPNDLVVNDGKLGGILTEVRRHAGGTTVVTGVGINVDLGGAKLIDSLSTAVGAVSDLASCGIGLPPRNRLATRLIAHLFEALTLFEAQGFLPFADDYARFDWLRDRQVSIDGPDGTIDGVADGVGPDGALTVRTSAGTRSIVSGSVRRVSRGA